MHSVHSAERQMCIFWLAGGNVERAKVGRQHEELGREGNLWELAFMCVVCVSSLHFCRLLVVAYHWPGISLKTHCRWTERGPEGGTWQQRAWDDPWRKKVTSLAAIGSSNSSEVMCCYDGESDYLMHALYSCIYNIIAGYLYDHTKKPRRRRCEAALCPLQ